MLEENETQETSLQDLIDLVERDDLPTNEFTIEDKDPMVILGKLNEVIANLETLDNNINTTNSKANEALQNATQALNVANGVDTKATQATADATQALNVANGVDAKATQATTDATQALAKATQATADATQALNVANGVDAKATQATADATQATTDATQALAKAVEAVGTANTALSASNSAISYNEQTPTSAEQNQAQKNIGINKLFIKIGLADINACNNYEQLYTELSNSPNGTGVGSIGYASQEPIRTLLPAIPFSANYVNVYAKIIAGNDNNAWVIELSTIDLYSNGQTIPTYNLQIAKNIVNGVATYRVSDWYDPQGEQIINKNANYIKYKSGLTIQTGTITTTGASTYNIKLPIAMPSDNYIVVTSAINYNATEITISSHLVSQSDTQFKICLTYNTSSAHYSNAATYRWVAICLGV